MPRKTKAEMQERAANELRIANKAAAKDKASLCKAERDAIDKMSTSRQEKNEARSKNEVAPCSDAKSGKNDRQTVLQDKKESARHAGMNSNSSQGAHGKNH